MRTFNTRKMQADWTREASEFSTHQTASDSARIDIDICYPFFVVVRFIQYLNVNLK